MENSSEKEYLQLKEEILTQASNTAIEFDKLLKSLPSSGLNEKDIIRAKQALFVWMLHGVQAHFTKSIKGKTAKEESLLREYTHGLMDRFTKYNP